MNLKQLLLLIVAGCVIGGIGWSLHQKRAASWQSTGQGLGQKLLGNFPMNDVTQVTIKTSQAELNLVKADIWQVKERNGYPANFSRDQRSDPQNRRAEAGAKRQGRGFPVGPPGADTARERHQRRHACSNSRTKAARRWFPFCSAKSI